METVENIKWEMETKISALELDKEELLKTQASDVAMEEELEERIGDTEIDIGTGRSR